MLLDQLELAVAILIGGGGRQEIARIGEAVRADRPQLGQAEEGAVIFRDIAARRPVRQQHAEAHAARDQGDLARADRQPPQLGAEVEPALLGDQQQLAVAVEEIAVRHVGIGAVDVDGDALEARRVAVRQHRDEAVDEVGPRFGHGERIPAQAIGRQRRLVGPGANSGAPAIAFVGRVRRARPQPVEPGPAVLGARRGEGGAGELLGIEAEGRPLRRVAALRAARRPRPRSRNGCRSRTSSAALPSFRPRCVLPLCPRRHPAISRPNAVRNRPAPRRNLPLQRVAPAHRPDLGLLPAARRRHLVVRDRADAVRAAAGDRRGDPPERQPHHRLRTICAAHAGGGATW